MAKTTIRFSFILRART